MRVPCVVTSERTAIKPKPSVQTRERRPRSSASPPSVGCQPPSAVCGWADGNTSPTRKRGDGIIPRLRVGLVLTPLVQLLAAIPSGQFPSPLGRPAVLACLNCLSHTGSGKRSFQSVRSQAGARERGDEEKLKFYFDRKNCEQLSHYRGKQPFRFECPANYSRTTALKKTGLANDEYTQADFQVRS